MNLLFVAYKPRFISSNKFLNTLKNRYNIKKMGFSGTLDPFAEGVLIIASNQYTKLFRFLQKTPKVYEATLIFGAYSKSLDIKNIEYIKETKPFSKTEIEDVLLSFKGKQSQLPPKYSAKKIDGKRSYKIKSDEIYLNKEIEVEIFDIELIDYSHPFLTFKASVSEGTYIRSLAFDIAKKLNTTATLSYLKREKEGKFTYQCEKKLNPIEYLNLTKNYYLNDINNLLLGKKLDIKDFEIKENGEYVIEYDNYFSIIKIENQEVKYILNKIKKGSL